MLRRENVEVRAYGMLHVPIWAREYSKDIDHPWTGSFVDANQDDIHMRLRAMCNTNGPITMQR